MACRAQWHDYSDYSNGHCRCDAGRRAVKAYRLSLARRRKSPDQPAATP